MKSHLVAFGAKAFDASAGLVTVPIIADDVVRITSNVAQLITDYDVLWSYFGGATLSRVRLNSSTSRIQGMPNLVPFFSSVSGGDNPPINDMRMGPIRLHNGENVSIQATNGAAEQTLGLLALAVPGESLVVPQRNLRKVRFTAAPTTVDGAWSGPVNIVLDDDLEPGTYGIYGMSCFEASIRAARLIINNQVERPGVLANQTAVQRPWPPLMGGLGEWGQFNSISPPFIQVFAYAAAAVSVVGYLMIGKVR